MATVLTAIRIEKWPHSGKCIASTFINRNRSSPSYYYNDIDKDQAKLCPQDPDHQHVLTELDILS